MPVHAHCPYMPTNKEILHQMMTLMQKETKYLLLRRFIRIRRWPWNILLNNFPIRFHRNRL